MNHEVSKPGDIGRVFAVVVALGGLAFAANKIGPFKILNNPVNPAPQALPDGPTPD